MNPSSKNKLMSWLLVLLLVANAATIAFFWLGRTKHPAVPKGTPKDFLIRELQLDARQQEQLEQLVKDHRGAAETLRAKTRQAKEAFFDLLKQTNVSDSAKTNAAKAVSVYTEELDLLTLDHFGKVRALCTPAQQKKFDEIIQEVTRMMSRPGPPMGPGGHDSPPPGGHEGPPPGGSQGEPPPGQ